MISLRKSFKSNNFTSLMSADYTLSDTKADAKSTTEGQLRKSQKTSSVHTNTAARFMAVRVV